jgi:predicted nucleotidyltransferase
VTAIHLRQPTAIPSVDQTLSESIAIIEQHLPRRVQGYYLVGSYAVGEAVPASDIDLIVVFKEQLTVADHQHFLAVRDRCKQAGFYTLDLSADSDAKLRRVGAVWFQTASRCLYGTDIRPQIPRKPIEAHVRDLMHSMYFLLARVRGNLDRLTVPLTFPDPSGHLYGYDQRLIRDGDHLRTVGTKDLVTNTLAIANVLTLRRSGRYVGSGKKGDIPDQYQQWIDDQWTWLVAEVYHTCRNRWGYGVPTGQAEQVHLRRLCHDVLAFENHFLAVYRSYLLDELQRTDAATVRFAVQRMGQLIYADREVVEALRQAQQQADAGLAAAIDDILTSYRNVERNDGTLRPD